MVTNMNQFLQQEIDRLSDENAQMDEQLAAVGASPVGDYMANAGVAAEDAAQNVVAAGVQELMAEEELPEIAMPEGLDDIDNQWEDEDFEELDAEVPQENAASLAEHTGGRHICGRCGSSYFSRDCAPDGKRISGKRRITGD